MKLPQSADKKIFNKESLSLQLDIWKKDSKKIVFTNGVFDILHMGHLILLNKSAQYADILLVGINSDSSVKRLKGENRPINNQDFRTFMLASLSITDGVILFEEDTPLDLIKLINPDILIKGGDYTTDTIVGAKTVLDNGGQVIIIDLEEGLSTTGTINKIIEQKTN